MSLDVIAPQEYNKIDRSGYGLEIFHYATPRVTRNSSPLRASTRRQPVGRFSETRFSTAVSSWREPHPLTRYVNFALLRPSFSRPLRPRVSGEFIESPMGPLSLRRRSAGLANWPWASIFSLT